MEKTTDNRTDFLVSLQVLNQIGALVISELTIPEMIATVYHHVNQLMDARSFAIGLYNAATENFEYTGARENDKPLPDFAAWAHDKGRFSGWIFKHKTAIFMNDYANDYKQYLPNTVTPLQGVIPGSCMYVPLLTQKEVIGILSVRTTVKNAYTLQCLEFLKTLGVFISRAIENAQSVKPSATVRRMPSSYLLNPLSAREMEVLQLLAKGFSNKAIAADLFISPSTVKTHTLQIYQKLEAANRTEAIVKAKTYGLIS